MKKYNKFLSCILVILLLMAQVFCYSPMVSAETTNKIVTKNEKLEKTILKGWKNRQSSIDIKSLNISINVLNEKYPHILLNNPEYFYVGTEYKYKYKNNKVTEILPKYNTKDKLKIDSMRQKINKAANTILKGITKDMSTYDRCLYIHDMLAQHTSYKNMNLNESFNMYGPLVKRFGVCQGYACAYNYLLKKAGVTSVAVLSRNMDHAWNKVKIGSNFYHVDVTHDDEIYNTKLNIEQVSHKHFLLSDEEVEKIGHYDWYSYGGDKAPKKYSKNAVHMKAKNSVYQVKGYYYYIDKNNNFVKQNNKQKITTIYKIGKEKIVKGTKTNYVVSNLSKLIYYKGNFYFNDCNKVYKYTIGKKAKCKIIKTISRETITKQAFIVDISIKQNGKLYYGVRNYMTNKYSQGLLKKA